MVKIPKRNKSKDNPYSLGFDEVNKIYTVEFIDNKKNTHKVEISEEVYNAFDRFELDDRKELNEYSRHIEHSEIYEDNLYKKAIYKPILVQEIVENKLKNEKLINAIQELPNIQRNRLIKYYFNDMTYEEIAREENCSKVAVKYSIDIAIKNISKKFNN